MLLSLAGANSSPLCILITAVGVCHLHMYPRNQLAIQLPKHQIIRKPYTTHFTHQHPVGVGQHCRLRRLRGKHNILTLCLPKTEISVFVTECVFFTSTCYKLHIFTSHDVYTVRKKKCSPLFWYEAIIVWFSQFTMTVVQN